MAWIDNRAWSHPKVVDLSDKAFRVWVNSVCYSSGYLTNGVLTKQQQSTVGSTPRVRAELQQAGLWDSLGPDIVIHDWDDHNGDRDRRERQRRERDAERKRLERAAKRDSHMDSPMDSPADGHGDDPQDVRAVTSDVVTSDGKDQNHVSNETNLQRLAALTATIGRAMP